VLLVEDLHGCSLCKRQIAEIQLSWCSLVRVVELDADGTIDIGIDGSNSIQLSGQEEPVVGLNLLCDDVIELHGVPFLEVSL